MSDTETLLGSPVADAETPFAYDLIRAQARSAGDRRALLDLVREPRREISYRDLVDRVETLTGALRAHGVGPEEPVAVLLERSIDVVVAMLAAMAAGGAYCPLDVTAPDARTAAVIGAIGARVVISDRTDLEFLPRGVRVVRPAEAGLAPAGSGPGPARPAPDTLAYVMHTSGSTGRPKGVAMSHRGLSRLIGWQIASGVPGLRTLQFTATSFDVTFQEILSTLATGGCLIVPSEEVRRDPAALLAAVVTHRIERLFLPYVALQLMAVAAQRLTVVPDSLRHVVTAGERLVITPAIRDFFAAIPHCRLDNHYGPTETHLVTSLTLPADPACWPPVPSIGAPVDGVTGLALDDQLDPVAEGETGELYVAGTCLARGYAHDPARTAERFVAHPSRAGERLYRTGDIVRAAGDGTYEFLGRADAQLKVRGYRVEPAEVENALSSHPRVDAAAVGLREVSDGVSVLVGYVQADGPVSHREMTEHLRGLLPTYMIPSRYLSVPLMPRTGTGKIDARALAELELPSGEGQPEAASLTEVITAIWTRVLGHDEFDADDDFFDVGGDSMLATWVVAELGQALERPVELSVFLEYSTVADLAGELGSAAPVAGGRPQRSQIVTLRPGPSARSLYLVHPLGGELIGYRDLARASRAMARILGVGWTGQPPAFGSSLGDIARTHLDQLRIIQPEGPYLLAGWSFGGVLAFEMAQQLTASGAAVDYLGLLDANPVLDPITGLPIAQTPFLDMLDAVLAQLDDPAVTEVGLAELTSNETWIQLMGAPIAAGASSTYLRTVLQTARACMNAAMRYSPQPYSGPLHLFQTTGSGEAKRARLADAIRVLCTGPCTITPIPGDHWSVIKASVADVATELDGALERAGAEGSATHAS
jgi:amino acid adenylation domain-containing protein